jgi:hypothetical protein
MLTAFDTNFNIASGTAFDASKGMTKRQFERIFQAVMDVRYPKHQADYWNGIQQEWKVKGDAPSQNKFKEINGNLPWGSPITEENFNKVVEQLKKFHVDGDENTFVYLEQVKFNRIIWR